MSEKNRGTVFSLMSLIPVFSFGWSGAKICKVLFMVKDHTLALYYEEIHHSE